MDYVPCLGCAQNNGRVSHFCICRLRCLCGRKNRRKGGGAVGGGVTGIAKAPETIMKATGCPGTGWHSNSSSSSTSQCRHVCFLTPDPPGNLEISSGWQTGPQKPACYRWARPEIIFLSLLVLIKERKELFHVSMTMRVHIDAGDTFFFFFFGWTWYSPFTLFHPTISPLSLNLLTELEISWSNANQWSLSSWSDRKSMQ